MQLSAAEIDSLLFAEQGSDPATPASGFGRLFVKADGLYFIDDAGTVTGPFGAPVAASGPILQVVTATLTTQHSTTNTTATDSGLQVTITPTAADSVIVVEVDGEVEYTVSSSSTTRRGRVIIRNDTDGVEIANQFRGRVLVAASAAAANHHVPIALRGRYTVDSLSTRTFKFQHHAVTSETSNVNGQRTGGVTITATEIAA